MNLVYRWQDAEGRGPYQVPQSAYWKDSDHEARNPSMMAEFGGLDFLKEARPGENLGCAFRSVEQMCRWFTPAERERMEALGYCFGAMHVDRVLRESDRQLVFARRKRLQFAFFLEAVPA